MQYTPIIIVFFVVALPIICVTLIVLARIIKGSPKAFNSKQQIAETELIQDIHRNLNTLEKRINSLETIILDTHKSNDS